MAYSKKIINNDEIESQINNQVVNNSGGFSFKASEEDQLERFLILGSEKGTYYVDEQKLTLNNVKNTLTLIKKNGKKVVDKVIEISDSGRSPKNGPAIFVLALASVFGDIETKEYANKSVDKVCRFSTDFYTWVHEVINLKKGKKSSGLQRAIARWYNTKTSKALAYQVCKYPKRKVESLNYSHRDMLRIAKPSSSNKKGNVFKTPSEEHDLIYKYITKGLSKDDYKYIEEHDSLKYIIGHEKAKSAKNEKQLISSIKKYNLTRESVPNNMYSKAVWKALLPEMPLKALLRNLGIMGSYGLFQKNSKTKQIVLDKILNNEALKKARIHPFDVYNTYKMYTRGCSVKGNKSWTVNKTISQALMQCFNKCFDYVERINGKTLIAIDVSGSMSWTGCAGYSNVTPMEAATIMAMVVAKTCKSYKIVAFSDKLVNVNINAHSSFDDIFKLLNNISMGGTFCELPIEYATKNNLKVDNFIICTDSETNSNRSPAELIKEYRKRKKINSKFAVMAFESSWHTLADPKDKGMLDLVGLDSAVPKILTDFLNEKK